MFQVMVSVPLVPVSPPAMSVEQLLATENFSDAENVPPVTPPPLQPPSFAFLMVTVGFTFVVLPAFGNAGANVAVPLAVLHVVPTVAAPAGAALRPMGSAIAAAAKSPVTVRILNAFLSAATSTAGLRSTTDSQADLRAD